MHRGSSQPGPSQAKFRNVTCDLCGAGNIRANNLFRHQKGNQCRKVTCPVCQVDIPYLRRCEHSEGHHSDFDHNKAARRPLPVPQTTLPPLLIDSDYEEIYETFARHITPYIKRGPILTIYNYQLPYFTTVAITELLRQVFDHQSYTFKISISFSCILRNRESGELLFYRSSQNNQLLLQTPRLIRNEDDFINVSNHILSIDLKDHVAYPSSKFAFVKATNVTFYITKLSGVAIGKPGNLPDHLRNNNGLMSLLSSARTGKPYNDNLCFFRCLALFRGSKVTALECETKRLLSQYCDSVNISEFHGITLDELEDASKIFDVGINVYSQTKNRATEMVYRTIKQDNILYLNVYENHFSFIKNFEMYSSSYRCQKCDKIFTRHHDYKRHFKTCDGATCKIYKNGVFELPASIFEQLQLYGIDIPQELQFFEYRVCFDIECVLTTPTSALNTARVSYTFEHQLASIAISSNVPGFDAPHCIVSDGCPKKLVLLFINYISEIADTATELLEEKFADYIPDIDELDNVYLQERFEEYISQIPIISFNGSKYDLKVLRDVLIPTLVETQGISFVIKRGSNYACIATEKFRFLDILSYLPPGVNYDGFLKAYGATSTKSYFPYEYFNSLDKLSSTRFPSYEDFYSSLKRCNTLEPTKCESLSAEEVLTIGRIPTADSPLSEAEIRLVGSGRYNVLRTMFRTNNWTFKDFLMYYNKQDVEPFLEAVENITRYYIQRNIDMFKQAISVPGIALRLAFNSVEHNATFFLFNRKHKDLVDLFFRNNVGGPAIIFHRFHESGLTKIRNSNGKLCRKVLGLDANALYLFCTAQEMPCGMFIRRRCENNFTKEYPTPTSYVSTEWLANIEHEEGIEIRHARNYGEFKVGDKKIPVDGYCHATQTAYNFHGCWYHGCPKCLPNNRDFTKSGTTLNQKLKHTKKVGEYIQDCGYNLIEIWECEWKQFKKSHTTTNPYVYPTESRYRQTESQLLSAICDGKFFGVVEVDLHVPENMKSHFQEMTPIFKNITVNEADIGEYMQQHISDSGQTFRERRYLIGSMFAKKILLITPLLKWYISHGLNVTKIYQVVEFGPKRCFSKFADKITDDRRAGDTDPSLKIVGDTSKLTGNSFYGYSIMDKSRHQAVDFCEEDGAIDLVNNPRFMALEQFEGGFYEVTSQKRTIKFDLPLQIGFFVYQLAKLRMLGFHYDVIDRFVSRDDYQLCEMDTDSLYLALSAETLDELIKPNLRAEWTATKDQWFPRTDSQEHRNYDKRTPGLFKVEWEGDGFVGLAAKTYYCYDNKDPRLDKYSSKGLNKSIQLTRDHFLSVLQTKSSSAHTNRGFVMQNGQMMTYEMEREGLSYLYCKRKVLEDGVSTTYLNV